MSSGPEDSTKKQANKGPSPLLISAFAGAVVASIVIPGAIWLRRRKNPQFSNLPPPARQVIRRGSTLQLPLLGSHHATVAPPKREPRQTSQPFPRITPTPTSVPAFGLQETGDVTETRSSEEDDPPPQQLDFNPALLTAKAFGIATLAVTVGAVTLVWGVKSAMGVENTEQFARRMREIIITRMPILSSRIHRSHTEEYEEGRTPHVDPKWNWDDAEKRLTDAFDKDGLSGWAEVAVKELEAEEVTEREKRAALGDARAEP
ncbi:hypothetical protein AAF712_000103 [Marasmius tenuissimus]|uniref:Uncharacterized protein n=1 Tax=Marasmius tenuissimus TaxID=585030 RepID=A0ABR3AFV6_9AGAR